MLLIILCRLQLQVVFVVGSDHELLGPEIGEVAAARVRDRSLVLGYLLVAHFLYTQVVLLEIVVGLRVVLLLVQMVLQCLLQGIHASVFFAWCDMICVYVVVELKELVVEVLVGDGRLRAKYPRLVPGSSSQNTIRLHQILLHLVIDNIRLRQFLVFEYLWLLLITTFAIIVSILAIESVWIIFLFSNFYEEVVFGSTSNATRPAVESKFLW